MSEFPHHLLRRRPDRGIFKGVSPIERFWSFVKKTKTCWLYIGDRSGDGYGRFGIGRKQFRAHRVSWILSTGKDPGDDVLHNCDCKPCIRPSHLKEGTHQDNMADLYRKDPLHNHGERNGQHKLTEMTVHEVRRMFAAGCRQFFIAKRLKLRRGIVHGIVHRKSWKHV